MAPRTSYSVDQHPPQHPDEEPLQAELALRPRENDTHHLPTSELVIHPNLSCPSQPSQPYDRLTKLHHDVLDPIVGFVAENRKDLLNLCLVSVVLYLNCIPWIYRQVVIDFADLGISALLLRLCYVGSQIPTYVRTVALKSCGQASRDQWELIIQALSRFTRLENMSWDSHAGIPGSVLSYLNQYHPETPVQAYIKPTYDGYGRNVQVQIFSQSPALAQLTHFELSGESSAIFYDNFKCDLLQFLDNTPNLAKLRIHRGPIEEDGFIIYPEMLNRMQTIHLPPLVALHLSTRVTIFTRSELEVWGSRQGWSELQHLSISRATDLIPFISRVPQLTYLHLTADLGLDMDELSRRLDLPSPKSQPLGLLDTLVYNHFSLKGNASGPSLHVVPWSVIDTVKNTLTRYHSVHQPYEVFRPGYATPNDRDLCLLKGKCPKITDLAVDVSINTEEYESIPVFQAFATFPHLRKLLLYIHRPRNHIYGHPNVSERHFDSEAGCSQAYKLIIWDRARIYPHLTVIMKEIVDFANVGNTWRNGVLWMDGNTTAKPKVKAIKARELRNTFAYLTGEQLMESYHEEERWTQRCGPRTCVIAGVGLVLEQALKKELERREKETRLTGRYGSTTVYDELMDMKRQ